MSRMGGLVGPLPDLFVDSTLGGVAWIHKPGCGYSTALVHDTLIFSKKSK